MERFVALVNHRTGAKYCLNDCERQSVLFRHACLVVMPNHHHTITPLTQCPGARQTTDELVRQRKWQTLGREYTCRSGKAIRESVSILCQGRKLFFSNFHSNFANVSQLTVNCQMRNEEILMFCQGETNTHESDH